MSPGGLCRTSSQPQSILPCSMPPPSDAKAISAASCTAPCQQPPGKKRWQRVGVGVCGLRPSATPEEVGLTRRGLFFSPGVKHVDLLLIDGGMMILIKMQAGMRAPLRAARSLGGGEGKASVLFCSLSRKSILLPSPSHSESGCNLKKRVWISLSL